MSIEWTRAEKPGLCGRCGQSIEVQDRVQIITVARVTRKLIRCAECAGGAPPELPADLAPPAPNREGFASLQSVKPRTRGDLRRMSGSVLRAVND